jgi:hypothetical protein
VDAAGPDISTVVGPLQQVFGEVRLTSYTNVIYITGFNKATAPPGGDGDLLARGPSRLRVFEGKGELRELILHT